MTFVDAVSGVSRGAERRRDMLNTPRTSDGLLRLLSVRRYTDLSGWVAFLRPRKLRFQPLGAAPSH